MKGLLSHDPQRANLAGTLTLTSSLRTLRGCVSQPVCGRYGSAGTVE